MFKTIRQATYEINSVRNDIERIEKQKSANDTARLQRLEQKKADSPVQKRIDKMRDTIRRK